MVDTRATRRITIVWLVLMLATGLSWSLGANHFPGHADARTAAIGILVVAMIKVRLVVNHFMEIRHAPLPLRLACEMWVLIVAVVMIALYLSN